MRPRYASTRYVNGFKRAMNLSHAGMIPSGARDGVYLSGYVKVAISMSMNAAKLNRLVSSARYRHREIGM